MSNLIEDNLLQLSVQDIYSTLVALNQNSDDIYCYEYHDSIKSLCHHDNVKAKELFYSIIEGKIFTGLLVDISVLILLEIAESDFEWAYKEARFTIEINREISIRVLSYLKYSSGIQLEEAFSYVESKGDIFILKDYILFYSQILNNLYCSEKQQNKCFQYFVSILNSHSDEKVEREIFFSLASLSGYEQERFDLYINHFISKDFAIEQMDKYFCRFKSIHYIFDLIISLSCFIRDKGEKPDIHIFAQSLCSFQSKNEEETNNGILWMLTQNDPEIRMDAVHLIIDSQYNINNLNLTVLNELEQLRALEVLLWNWLADYKKRLKLVLQLWNSSYKNVVTYLQQCLSYYVSYCYYGSLYEDIKNYGVSDFFLEPINNSLKEQKAIIAEKEKINELNSCVNDSKMRKLYFKLEGEEHSKLLQHSNEDLFFKLIHTVQIVRGTGWQIGQKDISLLGKVSTSMTVNMQVYRFPYLIERYYNKFISRF